MSRGREREREDYGPESAGIRNKVSVLVRNIPLNFTSDDLRAKFEKFGELRDVYIPRDYYTQRSRGFGFIEFRDARDADEAIYRMDHTTLAGRTIEVMLSKEGRKTPRDMMIIETKQNGAGSGSGYGGSDRRDRRRSRSPRRGGRSSRSRSPRRGSRYSASRSRSPRGGRDYDRGREYDRGRDREYDRGRDRDYERDARDRDYDRGRDRDHDRDARERDIDREGREGRAGGDDRDRRVRSPSPRAERDEPRKEQEPVVDEELAAEGGFDPGNDYY